MGINKKYILKALILAVLLIVADRGIGSGLEWMYRHQMGGDYWSATRAIEQQEADVLILGSSRARHHYNPQIFKDSLGMEVYNAGRDGCFLVYQWAQLKLMLDRYIPKVVILEVTPYDFNLNESDYDRLSGLLPYQNCASFWKVIRKKSQWERWKCLSAIYPYNSQVMSLLTTMGRTGSIRLDGFEPIEGSVNHPMETGNGGASETIDEKKVKLMGDIIDICAEKDIALYMVTSPYFIHFTHSETLDLVQQMCEKRNVPYISYLNHPIFADGSLYQTADHLNAEGADIFSSMVAEWIKTQ